MTLLVVALGRALGPDKGRVCRSEEGEALLRGALPTGRDGMEDWVFCLVGEGVGEG